MRKIRPNVSGHKELSARGQSGLFPHLKSRSQEPGQRLPIDRQDRSGALKRLFCHSKLPSPLMGWVGCVSATDLQRL